MPTALSGVFFLAKQRPQVGRTSDGLFQLSMLTMDRRGTHEVEAVRFFWVGEAAQAFWAESASGMTAGAVLEVQADKPRAHALHPFGAELQARVVSMQLKRPGPAGGEQPAANTETTFSSNRAQRAHS
jgi:hypothetical protein